MGKKKIVWMRSVWCKSAREHPDLSPSTALRRCFVVCLSVYLVVASSFKQNSRSQPQLVFLQVCFYLVHFFMCAGLFPAQRANRHNPRSFNASGDKSLDERQLDRCYQCRSPIYHCNSLLLGREENTITRPMTLLVFRFLFVFTLSCCDQDHNKKKKKKKTKGEEEKRNGSDPESDDQVITLLFQCLLGGLFSQNRKKKVPPTFWCFERAKTRAHVGSQYKYIEIHILVYLGSGGKRKTEREQALRGWWVPAYLQRSPCCCTVHNNILNNHIRETFTTTQPSLYTLPYIFRRRRLLFISGIICGARKRDGEKDVLFNG